MLILGALEVLSIVSFREFKIIWCSMMEIISDNVKYLNVGIIYNIDIYNVTSHSSTDSSLFIVIKIATCYKHVSLIYYDSEKDLSSVINFPSTYTKFYLSFSVYGVHGTARTLLYE